MLIIGRAVAGVGASALLSGSLNIIAYAVPIEKRAAYTAGVSSTYAIASIAGPLIGGKYTIFALEYSYSFPIGFRRLHRQGLMAMVCFLHNPIAKILIQALRSFWINLPIGSVAFLIIAIFFSAPRRASTLTLREKLDNLDFFGALFFIGGTVCLLLALQWGGSMFPWKDSQVWGLFIGVALLVPIFVWIQIKRGKKATMPPSIIKQRTVLVCTIYSLLYSMVTYT